MAHKPPTPGWTYHPYELAVVGEPGVGKSTLARRLVEALGLDHGLDLGFVDQGEPEDRPGVPGFLDKLKFLDQDGLIVEARGPTPLARIEVLDHGLAGARLVDQPPLAAVGPWYTAPRLPWSVPYFHRDEVAAVAALVRAHWEARTAARPVYGLVLTGGRSLRMGVDKAALAYGEFDESRRLFRLLGDFCSQVFVSCRSDQADLPGRKGLPQIHDRFLDMGPVSGLLSAFEAHPDASWIVVACDLPRVDRSVISALVARRNPYKVATAFRGYQNLPEPLCAVYEPKARARLFQFLAAGSDCPRKMMIHSPVELLDPRAGDPLTRDPLTNVNTPEERREVLRGFGR